MILDSPEAPVARCRELLQNHADVSRRQPVSLRFAATQASSRAGPATAIAEQLLDVWHSGNHARLDESSLAQLAHMFRCHVLCHRIAKEQCRQKTTEVALRRL